MTRENRIADRVNDFFPWFEDGLRRDGQPMVFSGGDRGPVAEVGRVSSSTRVVPLGGLGEIGLNALALEACGAVVLIDCGLLFPQAEHPGVDRLIPDLSWLLERKDRLAGIFLTHGHEDHIGALSFLMPRVQARAHGTAFTVGLAADRLAEVSPTACSRLSAVCPGDVVEAGPFRVHFVPVTHSIPGACALVVESPGGVIVHTGDFKLDPTPVEGPVTALDVLGRWGGLGVDLLCCDSTSAGRPGSTPSERSVEETLRQLVAAAAGRVYVASFASHVHRMQQVLEASRLAGRRVAFLGRSVVRCARLGRNLGHLRPAPGDVVPEPRTREMVRSGVTVVLGGSQAEPGSALWRVARGRHPHHRIEPGDVVLLSSKLIPGNERAIHRLIDRCLRLGADVYYEEMSEVHVSGHGSADDVRTMLDVVRPAQVLPVHGEMRHLEAMARVARRAGIPGGRVFRRANGETLILEGGRIRSGAPVPVGRLYVDGGETGRPGDEMLTHRVRAGTHGVAIVVLGTDGAGNLTWGPRVDLVGVVLPDRVEAVSTEAEAAVADLFAGTPSSGVLPPSEADIAQVLRRFFRRLDNRRPVVRVTVVGP